MNKKEYRNEGGGDEGGGKEVKRGGGGISPKGQQRGQRLLLVGRAPMTAEGHILASG